MSLKITIETKKDNQFFLDNAVDKFKGLKKILKQKDWFTDLESKKAILLAKFLSDDNFGKYVKTTLDGDRRDYKYVFKQDDATKKIFVVNLGQKWKSESTLNKAYNCLIQVENIEDKLGKKFIDFNSDDVSETILDFYKENGLYTAKLAVKVFSEYEKAFTEKDIWTKSYSNSEFNKILKEKINERNYVTQDELYDLYDAAADKQTYIVPILIFNGIRLSRNDDKNELSYLEVNDLNPTFIRITHGNHKRDIDIDNDLYVRIKQAAMQAFVELPRFNGTLLLPLNSTKYLLRSVQRSNNDSVVPPITFTKKLENVSEEIEVEYALNDIKAKAIANSGKFHFINKYLNHGHSLTDSVKMTLYRFGEWDYSIDQPELEINPTNYTRLTRMKKLWETFYKINEE